jgi:hypothetical protein
MGGRSYLYGQAPSNAESDKSRWADSPNALVKGNPFDAGAIGQGVQHGHLGYAPGKVPALASYQYAHQSANPLSSDWTTASNVYTSGQPNLYQAFHPVGHHTSSAALSITGDRVGIFHNDANNNTSTGAGNGHTVDTDTNNNNGNSKIADTIPGNIPSSDVSAGAIAPPAPKSGPLLSSFPIQPTSALSHTHDTLPVNSHSSTAHLTSSALTHLQALHSLLQPLADRADELQEARKEVEMWRAAWGASEREKRGLESRLEGVQKGVPVSSMVDVE